MARWEIYDKAIDFNKVNIMLLPTIIIGTFGSNKKISLEFHFLLFHAGVLFLKSEVAENE